MLGGEHLVVLDEGRWRRVSLRDGSSEPYLAVSASSSDAGFSASPSGQLGLAYDDSGFVVLAASVPASEALEGHREWPSNVGARRGGIAWSADESQIVVSGSRAIAVIDVRSGATAEYPMDEMGDPLNSAGIPEEPVTASWGVDGTSIVFATRSGLWQLDGQTGSASLIATTPRPGGFTAGTRLSPAPDGSAMAVGTAFGVFLPEPGGTWRQISRVGLPSSGGDLHWSDDGSAVAYSGATASGQPFGVIEAPVQGDDRVITVGGTNGTVLGWIGYGRIVFVFRAGG